MIVVLVYIINPNLEFVNNNKYIIIIHISLLFMELTIECFKLYKIYLNDYKTNSQPANVIIFLSFNIKFVRAFLITIF